MHVSGPPVCATLSGRADARPSPSPARVNIADILTPDRFAEIVGPQSRAFGETETAAAITAALDEAETLTRFRAAALTALPSWLPDPVARIALFVLSQTAEGWDAAQLDAAARQYRRAVAVLTARAGTLAADSVSNSGAITGDIADLPSW